MHDYKLINTPIGMFISLVPRVGIEPTLRYPERDFESRASANSAIAATKEQYNVKGAKFKVGILVVI